MKHKRSKPLFFLLLVVFLAGAIFSGYKILEHYREQKASADANQHLIQSGVTLLPAPTEPDLGSSQVPGPQVSQPVETTPGRDTAPIRVDFEALWQEGEDIVAWLYCPDTVINYPIVFSGDNEYYLYRLPNGQWNRAGSLFLDYQNDRNFLDYNSVVYGHNMKDDSMFGTLMYYQDPAYWKEHPVLYLLTPYQYYRVDVAAMLEVEASNQLIYSSPWDPLEQQQLLDYIRQEALYDTGVELDVDHSLLTLSTCITVSSSRRYVLIGRMTEIEGATG